MDLFGESINHIQCGRVRAIRHAQIEYNSTRMSTSAIVQQLVIYGLTQDGQRFRPSDWAERLAGVLSPFRPAGVTGGPLTYSPYAVPTLIDGVRCVVVDQRLRELEPLAWKFAYEFAQDNHLKTGERSVGRPLAEE
ncbi:uncharacterized protein DUF3579 [Paralcaligenes ureilyticus]|uniref:Uncharacterized protein DUF3579 n=2 Tax=Paralcaligenes ureilyticus TaxID=627131 RepID=A0A4R3LPX9_9BURK|nr:uncharacterized protein DUF3579 [Paralcaligenes ureilyticus]